MANKPGAWIPHAETFVSSSSSAEQQNAGVDAIAVLVKSGVLTIQTLVKDMELYLTTTDNVIRRRGILLLAEVLTRLSSKPLDHVAIHSLAEFFTSRLEDWHALHGALVGCLALLRRKYGVGMVAGSDARALAQSYLQNVQVQMLGLHDRKLCFELLQCLINVYPEEVSTLGEELIYGICEAIDNEKDPGCLMLTFHIIETVVRLFPDPSGPTASFAEELFEILSRYFPIYFTHPKSDDFDIKRDDLSLVLMHAVCSTPFFEPFAIPLLLEKLSSSLPLAKIDSLKYLRNCILHYGADRVAKHTKGIWRSLKEAIFTSAHEPLLLISESAKDSDSQESEIFRETLICLQTALSQFKINCGSFIRLVTEDEEFDIIFLSVAGETSYKKLSMENQQKLRAVASVLSTCAKVSGECCDKVFQRFFSRLMDLLKVSSYISSSGRMNTKNMFSGGLNFGALYLSVELLSSCRDVAVTSEQVSVRSVSGEDTWFCLLQSIYAPLTYALGSIVTNCSSREEKESTSRKDVYCGVKGLQLLATLPGRFLQMSDAVYEDILSIFMSIIAEKFENFILWRLALGALVQISSFIEQFNDSEKGAIYKFSVVEKIISLLHLDYSGMPLTLKLESALAVGTTSPEYMSRIIQELEVLVFAKFSEAFVEGSQNSAATLVHLLDCYSSQVLPWCSKTASFEEVPLHFALYIWNQMENISDLNTNFYGQEVYDSLIMTMKIVVGNCKVENQLLIVRKAYDIIQSTISSPLKMSVLSNKSETVELFSDSITLSYRDKLLIALFASVLVALRPQTIIPDVKVLLKWLVLFLVKGHISAAQALGSIVNKWPIEVGVVSASCTLEEALDIIFQKALLITCNGADKKDVILGLSWIGKGLLMRGHEKVKEIVMLLFKYLLPSSHAEIELSDSSALKNDNGEVTNSLTARSAADAFHTLLSDSELCLNKKFHATIRPLYKQRFFSTVIPLLLSSIKESDSSSTRTFLYRAFGHVICNTPHGALITEANKLMLPLLEALSALSVDVTNKDLIYSLLLVLSGILMDENGRDIVIENVHIITTHLLKLTCYPHMMLVRETAIQCLVAMSGLPYARIYPMRQLVLRAVSKALDDPKRPVRLEAVRCQRTWSSIL